LKKFDPLKAKYISREFQDYGYRLAQELNDLKHRALYIKLAKELPRRILEEARNFVKDASNVKNPAKLFMWKVKSLKSQTFIGTSGFSYPHWKEIFYPQNLPQKDWFLYYTKYFDTVELNVSFYRLPRREVFEGWRKRAGAEFVFAVKGWRWITHIKKLKNCRKEVEKFFETASPIKTPEVAPGTPRGLRNKDVVLWQLPPGLKFDGERLGNFLAILPKNWRHAFEFRHSSWGNEKTWEILRQYQAAVVFQDFPGWPIFNEVTADFVYLRFHGKENLYSSCYTDKELENWAKKIKNWQKQGLDVYTYFNNDALGYAIKNAKTLKKFLISND